MFTLFHVARLIAMFGGAAVLGGWGWDNFRLLGALVGAPLGLVIGAIVGQIPLLICLKWVSLQFARMSEDELLSGLHAPDCLTPNLHLLELNRRGYDIRRELPHVHSLLTSPDVSRRTAGWAALVSAFPDWVEKLRGYRPTSSDEECRRRTAPLREMIEQETEYARIGEND